jgi:hypothetical protein
MIDFTCPGRCADLHVADELAGRVIKCRECAEPCRVPVPPAPKPTREQEEAPKPEPIQKTGGKDAKAAADLPKSAASSS